MIISMLLLLFIISAAFGLDHHYHKQRKIRCSIQSERDITRLHHLRQSQDVDLWDEGIDQLPSLVTMRVSLEILPLVRASFTCQPPEKIPVPPVEKGLLAPRRINPLTFFNDYHPYDQMVEFVNGLASRNPQRILKVESMGKSGEGRDMPVVHLGKANLMPKRSLWVNGGQHAREWIAPAACLYLMDKVTQSITVF